MFYVFTFPHRWHLRQQGFLFVLPFFALWIGKYYEKAPIFKFKNNEIQTRLAGLAQKFSWGLINLFLFVSVIGTVVTADQDMRLPFSDSKKAAQFILEHHLENRTFVAFRAENVSALLPYLPGVKPWYPDVEDYGTFIIWNQKYMANRRMWHPEMLSRIEKKFPSGNNVDIVLILCKEPLKEHELEGYKLIYKTKKKVFWYGKEKYYIYERRRR